MKIALDFDNTIVSYDQTFYEIAKLEKNFPLDCPKTKLGLRDYLRSIQQEDRWTEIQGEVYGPGMKWAEPYPGALDFMKWAAESGCELAITSHRTLKPFLGKPYDLHDFAFDWIKKNINIDGSTLIKEKNIFFKETKDQKIYKVIEWSADVLVDDLIDVLSDTNLPEGLIKILFDPGVHYKNTSMKIFNVKSWFEIKSLLENNFF